MAGVLKKYGFINAKLRARISKILDDDFFSNLIRAHSVNECIQLFKDTPFYIIESVYNKTGDLKMVELALFKHEMKLYIEIEKYVEGEVLSVVKALASRYEIDNLKNILRLWFDRAIRKRDITAGYLYIYRDRIHNDLKVDQILSAETLEDIAVYLKGTPYSEIIQDGLKEVSGKQSIFPVEILLDRYFSKILLNEVEKLKGRDLKIARRLVGIEIDMQNVSWIVRFKRMYNLPFESAIRYILPFGYLIKQNELLSVYDTQNISQIISGFMVKKYSGLKTMLTSQGDEGYSRLILIERIVDKIIMYEVEKILLGYPFTIGIILVYFILKRSEIRKIITILNAKQYNIEEDRIKSIL